MADIEKLVQALIDAAHDEGNKLALRVFDMKPLYEKTHAARDALMDAIDAARGVLLPEAPSNDDNCAMHGGACDCPVTVWRTGCPRTAGVLGAVKASDETSNKPVTGA